MSKKLYTLICAGLFFSLSSSAQQYNGGTYTAVQAGLWSNNFPTPIWAGAAPPQVCTNCLVQLLGPGVVQLNNNFTLTGGSSLVIGHGVTLQIQNTTSTSFTTPGNSGNFIVLTDVGNNSLVLQDNTSLLDATNPNLGAYDGIFTATQISPGPPPPGTYVLVKQFGASPYLFLNNTIIGQGAARFGTSATGPVTLSGVGTLPIILSSFTASLVDGAVDLAWTTALEVNADHIAIQRSTDAGAHWNTLGTETAKGNASTATNYTYQDNKPAAGTGEYRLQLVDKDGKYTYSEVKTIRTGLITAVNVYPNPARDYVDVTLGGSSSETISIRLFNQTGQLLQEKNVSNGGGTTVPLSVHSYPQGNYLIVVTGADGVKQASKLLITK